MKYCSLLVINIIHARRQAELDMSQGAHALARETNEGNTASRKCRISIQRLSRVLCNQINRPCSLILLQIPVSSDSMTGFLILCIFPTKAAFAK